jgi:two-component system sensor histidine kinase HydH
LGAVSSELLAKQLQESQALLEISQMLAGTIDLDITLQQIADAANDLIKSASRTILHLLDDSGNFLQAVALSGPDRPNLKSRLNFKLGEGIAGIVLESCQTICVADVNKDPRYIPVKTDGQGDAPIRSLLVAPVITGEKRLGTLSVHSPQPNVFTPDDDRLLTTLGVQAAVAIGKARLYADLQAALQHEKDARAQLVQAEKLAALGRIVASVAHELNNPLQAIQNALYLIGLEEDLSQQAREDLHTVLNEANRMAELIARLRETYRPAVSEEFQLTSINSLVLDVQKLLATHLRHNQISFVFAPDDDLPLIPLIKDQIKQVILNICLNAVEAMPHGGLIQVQSAHDTEMEGVLLTITDSGPNIQPEILPYIFDPFVTTKEGGTGLGLAITYDIVQRHLGRIEVDSQSGTGTTFRVWLPLVHTFDADQQMALQWG